MSALSVLFYGRMKREGITTKQLSETMSASTNTVRKWLNNPEEMPLGVLLLMAKAIGIRRRELWAAIERSANA